MRDRLVIQSAGPGLIVRVLWFIFLGWWVGAAVSAVAWFLVLTVIGLPFGLWIINRLPSIMTLRPQEATYVVTPYGLVSGVQQRSFLDRKSTRLNSSH